MLVPTYYHVAVLVAFSCMAGMINAKPVARLQERAPQGEDRPGLFPEATSMIASLAGEGWNGLLDAIYGDEKASSALAAATSAVAEGDQGKAASYFGEATAALGNGWSQATQAADGAWSSYTSAYDENNQGNQEWTSKPTWTDSVAPSPTLSPWSAPRSTPSASSVASSITPSATGSAFSFTTSALTTSFVAVLTLALLI